MNRLEYRPPDHTVDTVDLRIELDPKCTRVRANLAVRRQAGAAPGAALRLDGEALELLSIALDGQALSPDRWQTDAQGLTLWNPPERFSLQTEVQIAPEQNSALMGLYLSNGNFFTQCEPEGFRRITFFPDRPDVMTRYEVTLVADSARWPVLLSNGNLLASGREPDGRHWTRWVDPFPKPSYLFAVVAGRLVAQEERIRTASGREALLQVWVEPDQLDRTDHAMQSLKRAIRWDESRFGLELDLDRFMIVAVSDFNMGAMENKGLNIFNTRYVFAHPRIATDSDFAAVDSIVAHEYFHNWTGNRVTCRDWFQLTLKEGLTVFRDQEYTADSLAAAARSPEAQASARAVKRIEDVRVLRSLQFAEDAGPMAHPIRPDAYEEINNFYTLTVYEKGAEVIRMLQTLLGREGFRRGMDLYFARHDGQAVTCEDFVAAMADANHRDLGAFGRWYSQSGTPRLEALGHWDEASGRYELVLTQRCPGFAEPLHMPVALGLIGPDGADLLDTTLELTETRQRFVFEGIGQRPVASLLRGFSAPVILEQKLDEAALAFQLAHDRDGFNRWEAAQRLMIARILDEGVDPASIREKIRALARALGPVLLDESIDPALRDQLLRLPSEGLVAEQMPRIDPQALRRQRTGFRDALAQALDAELVEIIKRHAPEASYTPEAGPAGRRGFRNTALALRVEAGLPGADRAAWQQFESADNLTDQLGAVSALAQSDSPLRETALARFESLFSDEPLVMDKWFMMQATRYRHAGDAPTLDRVIALLSHPRFDARNPNRIRALLGSFFSGNLAEFHRADGAGYRFWTEQVLRLDRSNPQVAARLARALDRWRAFVDPLQAPMRGALEEVRSGARSPDVLEIMGKALTPPQGHGSDAG